MSQFDDLTELRGRGTPIDRLTPGPVVGLQETLPPGVKPLPAYVDFIEKVGFGILGDDAMAIYNGLVLPDEIFGSTSDQLYGILLFADDMSGTAFGFNVSNWTVVEVSATGEVSPASPPSFSEFIRSKVHLSGNS